MAGELSISEQIAAANDEQVARDAEIEAEGYQWLAAVTMALRNPELSDSAKLEIYGLILKERDGEAVSVDRPVELRIEQNLERAGRLAESMAESALQRFVDAEESGLPSPAVAPPPPGPPPEDIGHHVGGGLGILTR